jgi:acetyltransferase-like isoleucine patch superfamily enzyme
MVQKAKLSMRRKIMNISAQDEKAIQRKKLQDELQDAKLSSLDRYRQKSAGDLSFVGLLQYELANLTAANLGGGLGYLLRKFLYARLFRATGANLILGKGLVVRHPGRIIFGEQVAIDDYVLLDASGAEPDGILIGDRVIISRNSIIQGKTGPVAIHDDVNIGVNTTITSAMGVDIEASVLIAGNCYIGGSRYYTERLDSPIMDQGWYSRGPVTIGFGSWLGAGVIVLDGISIGKGCIIGAGATVTKDIPNYAIAMGVPARVVGSRAQARTG